MALDARPGAYADSGRLALLAELLGIADRHSDVRRRPVRGHAGASLYFLEAAVSVTVIRPVEWRVLELHCLPT